MIKIIKNNKGFTLVAALMTLVLLMAVSTIVFVVTTKDLRIVTRSIGEKKAFSATEAGIHDFMNCNSTLNGISGTACNKTDQPIAGGIDPHSKYSIGESSIADLPASVPIAGYEIGGSSGKSWGDKVTAKTVTGKNTAYGSEVQVDIGVGYGPVEISTGQPAAGG